MARMRLRYDAMLRIETGVRVHHGRGRLPVVLGRHGHTRLGLMHHLRVRLHDMVLLVQVRRLLTVNWLLMLRLRLTHHSWIHRLSRSLCLGNVRSRRVGFQRLCFGWFQLFFQPVDDSESTLIELPEILLENDLRRSLL